MLPTMKSLQKPKRTPRQSDRIEDINLATPDGGYAHFAKATNSNYVKRLTEYHQQLEGDTDERIHHLIQKDKVYKTALESMENVDKKRARVQTMMKFDKKMQEYDDWIQGRRERLRDLLWREEHAYIKETVDRAQMGKLDQEKEFKQRIESLHTKKEAERQEIVHQKRIQQYMDRCDTVRPLTRQQQCYDAKLCNLQQMRENAARKEKEKEMDNMWHQVMVQENNRRIERDQMELIERRQKEKKTAEIHRKQILGLTKLREEMKRVAEEDALETEKMIAKMAEEQRQEKELKALKHKEYQEWVRRQQEEQIEFARQRREREKFSDLLFAKLTQQELEREQAKIKESTENVARDMVLFTKYMNELKETRKREEAKMEELIEAYRKQTLDEEARMRCRDQQARQRLQEEVMEGRKKQLEAKEKEAEFQKQIRQAEKETYEFMCQQNDKLRQLNKVYKHQAVDKYRTDLEKQIQYIQLKREQERLETERWTEQSSKLERDYMNLVEQLHHTGTIPGTLLVHPFRRSLNQKDCHCPNIASLLKQE